MSRGPPCYLAANPNAPVSKPGMARENPYGMDVVVYRLRIDGSASHPSFMTALNVNCIQSLAQK